MYFVLDKPWLRHTGDQVYQTKTYSFVRLARALYTSDRHPEGRQRAEARGQRSPTNKRKVD